MDGTDRWTNAATHLIHLADVVHEHLAELAELNTRDYGVPISYAGNGILLEQFLRHFAGYVDKPDGTSTPVSGSAASTSSSANRTGGRRHRPWNGAPSSPRRVAPALAAGNAVVFKPSELATPGRTAVR